MEPLTTAAIALGSVVATKALEKTGEKVGETLWEQTGKFLNSLNKQSPDTVAAIEKVPQQPLDYGKAVLEVESAAKTNPEVAQAMTELATTVEAEPLPNLAAILKDIAQALNSQPSKPQIYIKTIEKLVNFAQGDINIHEQNITI
ncbi:conserved hypothetical protein [Gloeothece citriformis PCC 7424]|uniref:Uncharacterized protein n=1 Tax=Gloeothece citriformis (strain PCC 7424) TaxID=65393 RepID=B7KKB1_GLOC7|nr:hypothetical protein [Gloeothece citriformis]ACK72244.1 conserved hypothetical protein [Gloeothece citriformis PCC 7424]